MADDEADDVRPSTRRAERRARAGAYFEPWNSDAKRMRDPNRVLLLISVLAMMCLAEACGRSATPTVPSLPSGPACGVERWAVKTLTDHEALQVDFVSVTVTTIAALNAMPTHCG